MYKMLITVEKKREEHFAVGSRAPYVATEYNQCRIVFKFEVDIFNTIMSLTLCKHLINISRLPQEKCRKPHFSSLKIRPKFVWSCHQWM